MTGPIDALAAGDDVQDTNELLRGMQQQLAAMGGGQPNSGKALGHISVPREGHFLFLPAGEATVNFAQGKVTHEHLGTVTEDLVTVSDLLEMTDREHVTLENLIFHADTKARVKVGESSDQWLNLDYVPLPSEDFREVKIKMAYPGQMMMLASTRQLPIGLGGLHVYASRIGDLDAGTYDSMKAVPMTPHGLYGQHGTTYADPTVWSSAFDSATWTVENTSGNGNAIDAEIQAREVAPGNDYGIGKWRTIASASGIGDGDHAVLNIWQERHHYLRCRVSNSTTGNSVSAEVEMTEASP